MVLLFFASCDEEDTGNKEDNSQSFTFTQVDGTPIEGATVELFTSKTDKYSGQTALLTGTTDETGTVNFSATELDFDGVTLYIFAEKGYYSNINAPSTIVFYTGLPNQLQSSILPLSLVKSFTTPSKWLLNRTVLNNEDITSYSSECAKDDYISTQLSPYNNEAQLALIFNDGLNECAGYVGGWMYFTLSSLNGGNAAMQDGYQIPSGLIGAMTDDGTLTGYDITLEIKYDSLYYSATIPNVGLAMNVYAAEF